MMLLEQKNDIFEKIGGNFMTYEYTERMHQSERNVCLPMFKRKIDGRLRLENWS